MFTTNKRLASGFNQYTIENVWKATFGEVISNYTTSVKFFKGTLTVYISSSPLKQELNLTKENVIEKLNKNLPYHKVTKLIVR